MGNILHAAEKSGIFDMIHVSTDCEKIASVATDLGFRPDFLRDPALADDYTPLLPVLKWVVEKFAERGYVFDIVFLLMPCALLIQAEDLKRGLDVFKKCGGKNPLMAMAPYPVPIEWAFNISVFPPELYMLTVIPAHISKGDIIVIDAISFVICVLGALIPAIYAVSLQPTRALQHDS